MILKSFQLTSKSSFGSSLFAKEERKKERKTMKKEKKDN
jgi:hypothetical protein